MPAGILPYLNLSMWFRVGSTSPVTFKMKLSVTTVHYSFQLCPIFCHKKLHLRCCIGLELSIVISSTKILKGIGWHHHDGVQYRGNIKNSKVFCIKLSFLYFISNGKIELISTHWCKMWLTCKHSISSNPTEFEN